MRTRLILLPLIAVLVLGLAACGDDDDDGDTPAASATNEDSRPGNGAGDDNTPQPSATTSNGDEVEASPTRPIEINLSADYDEAWYVFPISPALVADRQGFEDRVQEAATATGMEPAVVRTQVGRRLNETYQGLVTTFLDTASPIGLPLIDLRWCVPTLENPLGGQSLIDALTVTGATAELDGTVEHGDGSYDLARYTRELDPELVRYRAYVPANEECFVEITLTAEAGTDPPLEALQAFVPTIVIE